MVNVYLSDDLGEVFRLKHMLGSTEIESLEPSHPLSPGFEAARKTLAGLPRLSVAEVEALARLKMASQVIADTESHWMSFRTQLVADLLNPGECLSMLFELYVMTFGLAQVVESMDWRHYSHATPDICTTGPEMLVECKLVRSDKLFRIEGKLEEARRQHTGLEVPYVIAVGFDHQFSRAEIDEVRALAEGLKPWFEQHPDVSAGLIFTPADPAVRPARLPPNPLGLSRILLTHGAVTELLHHKAINPLPQGFSFRPR